MAASSTGMAVAETRRGRATRERRLATRILVLGWGCFEFGGGDYGIIGLVMTYSKLLTCEMRVFSERIEQAAKLCSLASEKHDKDETIERS